VPLPWVAPPVHFQRDSEERGAFLERIARRGFQVVGDADGSPLLVEGDGGAAEVHLHLPVGDELAEDDDLVGVDLVADDLERPRVAALVEAGDDGSDVDVTDGLAVLPRTTSHLLGSERPADPTLKRSTPKRHTFPSSDAGMTHILARSACY
jgi:hypothetical protein